MSVLSYRSKSFEVVGRKAPPDRVPRKRGSRFVIWDAIHSVSELTRTENVTEGPMSMASVQTELLPAFMQF